jgi:hypothetical protein
MSDFKDFLDKVLVSIRDEEGEQAPGALFTLLIARTIGFEELEPRDVLSPNELRRCYVAITSHLLADALKRNELVIFTDVFAEKLAEVAFDLGARGTADIVRRFGAHLERIDAMMQAQREEYEKASADYDASLAREDLHGSEGEIS